MRAAARPIKTGNPALARDRRSGATTTARHALAAATGRKLPVIPALSRAVALAAPQTCHLSSDRATVA
jgi:hypothetical protein